MERLRAEEKAATKIGAAHRGNADRKNVADKQRGARRNAAAVEIQRRARGTIGRDRARSRKDTLQQGNAAASVQAVERGRVARKNVAEAKQGRAQTRAATMLQAKERGNADRRRVAEQKRTEAEAGAAVSLQAATRGKMGREDAEAKEIMADAEEFEKMMRRMATAKRCAVRLQAALRGRVIRTRLRAADVRKRQSQPQDGAKSQEDELEELLAKASDQLTRTTATITQSQQRSTAPSPAPSQQQQGDGDGGNAAALFGEAGRLSTVAEAEAAPQPAGGPSSAPLTSEQMVALDMRSGRQAARARDYQTARQSFLRAYEVGGRTEARIAAVNMALKLGLCDEAAAAYERLLEEGGHAPPVTCALQRGHAAALGMQAAARGGAGGVAALPWRVELLPPPPDAPMWPDDDDGSGGVHGGCRARIVPATSAGERAAEKAGEGEAALSLAVVNLRPLLEPMVRAHGLDWADVVPVLEAFESVAELKAAMDEPVALLERLKSSVAKRPPSPGAGGYKGHHHGHHGHHHGHHHDHGHHGSRSTPRATPRKGAHHHGTPRKEPRHHSGMAGGDGGDGGGGGGGGGEDGGGGGGSATQLGVDQLVSAQAEQQQQLADGDGAATTALSHRAGDEPLFGAFSICCVSRQKEKPTGSFTPVMTPFETPILAQLLMRFGDSRFRPGGAMRSALG